MQLDLWLGEPNNPRWWARVVGFGAITGVLLGIIGPFGSFLNDEAPVRILYYGAMTIMGAVVSALVIPPLLRLSHRHGLPILFALAAAILIDAVPNTAISWVVGHRLWGSRVARVTPADWYGQTVLLIACIIGVWALLQLALRSLQTPVPARAAAASAPRVADLTDPVLCLQMEDHYVRVHRAGGSTLELMPLHDAIERFGGARGLQVHRSWWVADAAVTGAERDARNWRLRLTNGLTVPVARNRVVEVRARGWISEDSQAAE
jgi:hypothetical protein